MTAWRRGRDSADLGPRQSRLRRLGQGEDSTGQIKNTIPPIPPDDEPPGEGSTDDVYGKIWDLLRETE